MFGETYCLSLITAFLKSKNIQYKHNNAGVGFALYNHGCRAKLSEKYSLSIQTHTDVVGSDFAETALIDTEKQKHVNDGTFSYYDCLRFGTPDELFKHIEDVLVQVPS